MSEIIDDDCSGACEDQGEGSHKFGSKFFHGLSWSQKYKANFGWHHHVNSPTLKWCQ